MKFLAKFLSPQFTQKFNLFLSIKRARVSLVILAGLYIISLFGSLIANNKPLLVAYEGSLYFPMFRFYQAETFGQTNQLATDYKALKRSLSDPASSRKGFVLFPIIPYGSNETLWEASPNHPSPPTWKNIFGTDNRGRDVLTRLIHAFRISINFAIVLVAIGNVIGVFMGAVQGYLGGKWDLVIQRKTEIISAIPNLYLVIIIGTMLGKGLLTLVVVLSLFSWIGLSYYMRAEYLRLRQFYFVESAKALGMGRFRIMIREILPNALTPIITFLPFEMIGAIFALTSLDFLGYGLPAPTPSWGELIRQSLEHLNAWWLVLFTFMALFVTLLLMAFIGEGIREVFDPKRLNKIR